ncbi:unnamed protein product [Laminaria digitata]
MDAAIVDPSAGRATEDQVLATPGTPQRRLGGTTAARTTAGTSEATAARTTPAAAVAHQQAAYPRKRSPAIPRRSPLSGPPGERKLGRARHRTGGV